tara:strand:+ start:2186 stop:2386 length:201 start_codon:yes stop_codon:yes gene_type:complete
MDEQRKPILTIQSNIINIHKDISELKHQVKQIKSSIEQILVLHKISSKKTEPISTPTEPKSTGWFY